MTVRRPVRAASAAGARGRGHHSLAPDHLGEAVAAATLAIVVGGVALTITGIGIVAMGLTIGSRYAGSPPPDVGSLAIGPILLGVLVLLLGAGLTAGGIAVFNAVRRARMVTGLLAGLAGVLAVVGTVMAMTSPPPSPVVAVALTVAALVFGVATILLLRPAR